MMDLSPLDVRKKKEDFDKVLRGYDPSQVESFLDVAAERLEELVSERRRLRDRVSTLEDQLSDYRERERALNDALLSAQELREDARSQAEREVELRRQEAEARAEEILRDAREQAEEMRRDLERLRLKREQLLRSIRGTLRRFEDELEVEETRHAEESPEGEDGPRPGRRTFAAGAHGRVMTREGEARVPEANAGAPPNGAEAGSAGQGAAPPDGSPPPDPSAGPEAPAGEPDGGHPDADGRAAGARESGDRGELSEEDLDILPEEDAARDAGRTEGGS
jgi:DivIVA domain-containing protein